MLLAAALLVLAQAPAADPGRLVVLNKSAASATVIDLASGEPLAEIGTGAGPHEVALHPGGRWAVVADYGAAEAGSTLSVLDLEELRRARVIELGEPVRPHGLAFEPDGRALWLTAETRQQLWRVDFATGEVLARATTGQRVSHMVARAPDGRLFVTNIGSGSVSPVEADGTVQDAVTTGAGAEGVAVTPDGRQLWVSNREADSLSVFDPHTMKLLRSVECPGFPIRVAVTPDSALALVSCARAGEVAIYSTRDFQRLGAVSIGLEADDEGAGLFGDRFGASPIPIGITVAADNLRAWVANAGADLVAEIDLRERRVVRFLPTGREPDGITWVR
jgi:YVTN family beta-propeller protein